MTPDLLYLVLTAVLCVALTMPVLFARMSVPGGVRWAFGNRDVPLPAQPAWGGRAERAHRNLVENLAPFAAIVLVAHVIGAHSELTALGSAVFFFARVVHAAVYMVGLVYLRTAVFFVGLAGECLILWELFG